MSSNSFHPPHEPSLGARTTLSAQARIPELADKAVRAPTRLQFRVARSARNLGAGAILLWLGLGPLAAAAAPAEPARLTIDVAHPSHRIAPTLWGIFFEDINHSADGGIYPELVRNCSFEDAESPEHWTLVNSADGKSEMAIDARQPLNPFNRRSLRVRVDGQVSIGNGGYWGVALVKGERYQVRLAARAADGFKSPLTVCLEDRQGRDLARGDITGITDRWEFYSLDLTALDTDPKAKLSLVTAGKGTLRLDMVSVTPRKTWKNHGLRPDLCGMLDALKPSFVRFPGGCWVEGDDLAHMYHWKNTVGEIAHRQPLWNIWQYWATHSLGYHEYLQLSEDLGAEPLFCINVGMSHREHVPLDQMGPWVQDALDAIEYANGPTNTVWGGLRAKHGHPAPFNLKYLEIGNENGGPAYHERWELFCRAIKARHPDVQLVANVWGGYPTNHLPDIIDEHYYNNPEFFMQQADRYDRYDRKGPKVFVGEYAVTSGAGLGNLRGAIGEAAFMTGLERNSDIVVMASYAPLFCNANHKRWPINLINFDSSRAYGLPSYYVQQLFSEHRGDVVLPITVEAPLATSSPQGGAIGVGTWATQAEFKDIQVTRGSETLFAADFSEGTQGWKLLGNGEWRTEDGALRQNKLDDNIRAVAGDRSWTDYTYSLKARKLGGAEGFLILFAVQDENAKSWWNLGGWGNTRHALEMGGMVGNDVNGRIDTGRWYDIRIELKDRGVKCYLDSQLVHDATVPTVKSLYASAARDLKSTEVIVKVVNVSNDPVLADLKLSGVTRVAEPATAIVLTSEKATDENTLEQPRNVVPVATPVRLSGPNFEHGFPPNSLTVLRVKPVS